MNKKRIFSCLALAVLCLLLAPVPARADTGVLAWKEIDKPGASGNIVVSPSEVNDIAVGRNGIIYAVDSSENATKSSKVYYSDSAGAAWEDITPKLQEAGAVLPAGKIAVAPDSPSVVAVVADNGTNVYVSIDAGNTWLDTRVPDLAGTTIQAIAISRQYLSAGLSLREIAIGTADWGNGTTTGQVLTFRVGAVASDWQDQGLTIDPLQPGVEVSAVAYSPGYQRDNTLIAVASTTARTYLCLGKQSIPAGTTAWDAYSDYPLEIGTTSSPSAGDAADVSLTASLAVPSDFSATDETLRQFFVSYDRSPDASDDVYRIDDTTVTRLDAAGGAVINIASLAYNGTTDSGQLLAGLVDPLAGSRAVQVRRTLDPLDTSPKWSPAAAPPSGPGNARVSWNPEGDSAYCGTSTSHGPVAARDESAFSVSTDDGNNWQQLSIMDTTLKLSDLAPSPDSDSIFVATYSSSGPEGIWRSANTTQGIGEYWSRQLAINTDTDRLILRMSLNYTADYTLYAVEAGGIRIEVSHDRGNSWKRRLAPDSVIDAAAEDGNTIYVALPGGVVRKSTNSALFWEQPVFTGINSINMLAAAGNGTVLVGGSDGEVAYSTDGGASFIRIGEPVGTGDVQVTAGAGFPGNGIIYAATAAPDSGTWRWQIGASTDWEQIDGSVMALRSGASIGGLATDGIGTLYGLRKEPAGAASGGLTRTLDPSVTNNYAVEFDTTSEALPAGTTFDATAVFGHALPYLRVSGGAGWNDLWSIDTENEMIYRFEDTLVTAAPGPMSPAEGTRLHVDSALADIPNIAFSWTRPSLATSYSLEIALDPSLSQLVVAPVAIGPDMLGIMSTIMTPAAVSLTPGTVYYWGVRATVPLKSPWSEVRSFTIDPVLATAPVIGTPANGAHNVSPSPAFSWEPVSGANSYELQLSSLPGFETTLYDGRLPTAGAVLPAGVALEPGETYFWRVRAIEPAQGEWSTVANFTVVADAAPPAPPVEVIPAAPQVITLPASSPAPEIDLGGPPRESPETTPAYVWAPIIIGGVLIIAVTLLIVRTGR
jgi:hypothetical protein